MARLTLLLLAVLAAPSPQAWADAPGETPVATVQAEPEEDNDQDDIYFEEDFEEEAAQEEVNDPIEGVNRAIFAFNDGLDRYAIEPAATAFDYVVPDFAQNALQNGFDNLRFPILFFNHLFQGKPGPAAKDFARFAVNTTVGLAGLMDPASAIGLRQTHADFGQTLGYWGVPPGPYLMLPFFGPSDVRDTGGRVVDTGMRALGFFIPFWASMAMNGVDTLNWRSLNREAIQAERRAALDWYVAVRSAYTQYRENLVQQARRGTDAGEDETRGYYPVFKGKSDADR